MARLPKKLFFYITNKGFCTTKETAQVVFEATPPKEGSRAGKKKSSKKTIEKLTPV